MRDSLVSLGRLDAPAIINPSDSLKRLGVRSMRSATSLPNAHSLSALSCLSQPLGVRPSTEYRRPYSYNSQHSTSFIQDIVIPAKLHSNERNSGASFSARFSRRQPSHCGKQSEITIRTADTSLQPYVYTKAQSASSAQKKCSKSPQVIRYENEQVDLAQSRLLKRASEVMSHRVDRLYYMCGRSLSATDRYNVDKDELGQLRTLALTRRQHPEYHRKLRYSRMSGSNTLDEAIPIPQQPPPSGVNQIPRAPMPANGVAATTHTPNGRHVEPPPYPSTAAQASVSVNVGNLETASALPDRQAVQYIQERELSDLSTVPSGLSNSVSNTPSGIVDTSQFWSSEANTTAENIQAFLSQNPITSELSDGELEQATKHVTLQD